MRDGDLGQLSAQHESMDATIFGANFSTTGPLWGLLVSVISTAAQHSISLSLSSAYREADSLELLIYVDSP